MKDHSPPTCSPLWSKVPLLRAEQQKEDQAVMHVPVTQVLVQTEGPVAISQEQDVGMEKSVWYCRGYLMGCRMRKKDGKKKHQTNHFVPKREDSHQTQAAGSV